MKTTVCLLWRGNSIFKQCLHDFKLQSTEVVGFISDPALGRSLVKKCTVQLMCSCLFVFGATAHQWARASSFTRFLDPTQRRTTVGRNPLNKWSARRRDLCTLLHTTLTIDIYALGGIRTHNSSKRAAADPRLRTRSHWDRLMCSCRITKCLPKCASLELAVYVDTEHLTVDSSYNSPVHEVL